MTAPDKIYIDRGPRGGWMHRHKRMPDTVAEYVRLDPNARIVTVDQLDRWQVIIDKLAPGFVYGSGPYNETLPEITGMWNEIRGIIGEVKP